MYSYLSYNHNEKKSAIKNRNTLFSNRRRLFHLYINDKIIRVNENYLCQRLALIIHVKVNSFRIENEA